MRRFISPTAVVTVLIIVTGEAWFWKNTDSLSGAPFFEPTADIATAVAKHEMLPEGAGRIVLVGDSSCMMGLIPEDISADSCINLGTLSSFTLAGVEAMVAEAAENQTPPTAIVIAMLPQTLAVSEEQAETFGLLGPYLVAYDRSSVSYSPGIGDWHKWVFRKHQIGRFPEEFGGTFSAFKSLLHDTKGYFEEPGHYDGAKDIRDTVELSELSRRSLMAIAETCRRRQIPLVFWPSPMPADSISQHYSEDSEKMAREIAKDEFIHLGRTVSPAWSPELFGSVTHLNRKGAEQNSKELAVYLKSVYLLPQDSAVITQQSSGFSF
jgi:hypothetical protein